MEDKKEQNAVRFGGNAVPGIAGVIGGVAFAVLVPWVLLSHGQLLGTSVLTTLVMIAVIGGGVIALTAAFFSLVMPSSMNHENGWDKWEKWEKFKDKKAE
jgi:hypothetical protein